MSSSISSETEAAPHTAELGGRTIKCDSLNDALLLKIAEHAVSNGMPPVDAAEALRIVRVLKKYGLFELADSVARLSPPRFSTEEE